MDEDHVKVRFACFHLVCRIFPMPLPCLYNYKEEASNRHRHRHHHHQPTAPKVDTRLGKSPLAAAAAAAANVFNPPPRAKPQIHTHT